MPGSNVDVAHRAKILEELVLMHDGHVDLQQLCNLSWRSQPVAGRDGSVKMTSLH